MILTSNKIVVDREVPELGIQADGTFAGKYPLKILIAEDNFVNQKLIERILSNIGYQTDAVSNGNQVLNFISKKEYNVILMDIRMPEMDGYETTKSIRQMDVNQPYIIAMTANSLQSDREECLQNGMDDYISKPLKANEILSKLKMVADFIAAGRK